MQQVTKPERGFDLKNIFNLEQACYLDILLSKRTTKGKDKQELDYAPYSQRFKDRFGFRPNDEVMRNFDCNLQQNPLFYMHWYPHQRLYPDLPDISDIEWCPTDEELSQYLYG